MTMKIVFISNYLNGHQTEFCKHMSEKKDIEFIFLQTQCMDEERLKLGWALDSTKFNYLRELSSMSEKNVKDLIEFADVIILGDSKVDILRYSLKIDVLLLFYRERLFKKKHIFSKTRYLKLWYKYAFKYRHYETAVLCASAYASADFEKIRAFKGRKFKWGYFPQFIEYDIDQLMQKKKKNSPVKILWVGRLIGWKRCVDVIELAKKLKQENTAFQLNIVGNGILEEEIKRYINKLNLNDCVSLEGSCPQIQVRKYMEQANIFIISSTHEEGWGAVVNEAINSGCVVIGSHAAGAVPFLIENEKNGLIYKCENIESMYACVRKCLDNSEFAQRMGHNAYYTIKDTWNADNAAEKLIHLISHLKKKDKIITNDNGPCSISGVLDDWWFGGK